jgi:hypothetical protein
MYLFDFLNLDSSATGIFESKKDKVSYFGKIILGFLLIGANEIRTVFLSMLLQKIPLLGNPVSNIFFVGFGFYDP